MCPCRPSTHAFERKKKVWGGWWRWQAERDGSKSILSVLFLFLSRRFPPLPPSFPLFFFSLHFKGGILFFFFAPFFLGNQISPRRGPGPDITEFPDPTLRFTPRPVPTLLPLPRTPGTDGANQTPVLIPSSVVREKRKSERGKERGEGRGKKGQRA